MYIRISTRSIKSEHWRVLIHHCDLHLIFTINKVHVCLRLHPFPYYTYLFDYIVRLAPIIVDIDVHASPYHLKAATNIHEFPISAILFFESSKKLHEFYDSAFFPNKRRLFTDLSWPSFIKVDGCAKLRT